MQSGGMCMKKELERGAGILLPISSLPSNYGIGTLGQEAYTFVDQMVKANQTYWQVLPVGPTSFGDSPYQSFSSIAGNPYFIDLDILCEEKLLDKSEIEEIKWAMDEEFVEYETLWEYRFKILKKAHYFFEKKHNKIKYQIFCDNNKEWLDDYALFMACKSHFGNRDWLSWDEDIRFRKSSALTKYEKMLSEEISMGKFLQFKFYEQWDKLKEYAGGQGVKIIGDIPIYVALDSVDVWMNPELFQLDKNLEPVNVAGCPPDAFSDEGQKWGNPLYYWGMLEQTDFKWWRNRIAASAKLYDVIRIDHFIGIVRYYAIPADKSARFGWYEKGPGKKLIKAIDESRGDSLIIAEDLGVIVPAVNRLLKQSGYPGMKVLEFAFDGDTANPYLPHKYERNYVVYGGTHDNETLVGYYSSLDKELLKFAMDYCGAKNKRELIEKVIQMAYASVANTVIFQMQDILKKDNRARMNFPSTIGCNWKWRLKKGEFTAEHIKMLSAFSKLYEREQTNLLI